MRGISYCARTQAATSLQSPEITTGRTVVGRPPVCRRGTTTTAKSSCLPRQKLCSTKANQKIFALISFFFFSQITAANAKSTNPFPAVDLFWTGPALSAGSSAARRCCQLLKMVVVLHTSTAYKQRSVIRFLCSKGRTPIEIYREMQPTYGERCLALRSARWWCCDL